MVNLKYNTMYTMTINRYNEQTRNYGQYAHEQLTAEDVQLVIDHFKDKPVVEGFYQLVLQSKESTVTFYTCHGDILGYLKANHKPQ